MTVPNQQQTVTLSAGDPANEPEGEPAPVTARFGFKAFLGW
jgi:hypothetical protein